MVRLTPRLLLHVAELYQIDFGHCGVFNYLFIHFPFVDYRQVRRKEKVEAAQLTQMPCDMVSLCWWIH